MFARILIMTMAMAIALGFTGCGEVQEEVKEPIKIGAIFAVTGGASFLGAPESKTAQMLVDEVNAKGGIAGRKIELLIKDSGAKVMCFAPALVLARRLLRSGADALIIAKVKR